jgi:hypothetical protein
MAGMKTATIKLETSISVGGKTISEVTLREPLVKELLDAKRATKTDEECEVYLLGVISGLGSGAIGEMTLRSYAPLQAALLDFLSFEVPKKFGK